MNNLLRWLNLSTGKEHGSNIPEGTIVGRKVGENIGPLTPTEAASIIQAPPSGSVLWFAADTPPSGWLACDGSAVSRTAYPDLFAAIGTTWGVGNGSTTFHLPDLRGEFIRGWDNGRGIDDSRSFASAQADSVISHIHTVPGQIILGNGNTTGTSASAISGGNLRNNSTTTSTGGDETRPRNVAMLPIIKT